MWDCPACGCQAIAPDLAFCPQCFEDRTEEDVPKTNTAGSTNAWEEQEAGQDEAAEAGTAPDQPAPAEAPAAEPAKSKDSLSDLEAAAASLKRTPAAKRD